MDIFSFGFLLVFGFFFIFFMQHVNHWWSLHSRELHDLLSPRGKKKSKDTVSKNTINTNRDKQNIINKYYTFQWLRKGTKLWLSYSLINLFKIGKLGMRLSVNMRGLEGCLSCSIDWFFVKLSILCHHLFCPFTSVYPPLSELVSAAVDAVRRQEPSKLSEESDMGLFKRNSFWYSVIKGFIISVQKTHLYLTFFTRRLMWFSFSSRIFLKVSTSLWFSKSSLWRRWLFSSRVSQTACTQGNSQHVT